MNNTVKILWIVWGKKDFPKSFSDYEQSFIYFSKKAAAYGYRVVKLQIQDYDIEQKKFLHIREYDHHLDQYIKREHNTPQPDIILHRFNRCLFPLFSLTQNIPTINSLALLELTHDKFYTAKCFSWLSPRSLLIGNAPKEDLQKPEIFSQTDKFVIKPRTGSKWLEVTLWDRSYVQEISKHRAWSRNNLIIQEFIDSSNGIPWIVDGIHDVRVVVFGSQIPYVIVRTPSSWDFRCNLAQWWWQKIIAYTDLPTYRQETIQTIMQRLVALTDDTHAIYSIDLFQDAAWNPRVIELNSSIGLGFLDNFPELRDLTLEHLCRVCDEILTLNNTNLQF